MNLPTLTVLMVEDLAADREIYRLALCQDSSCVYDLLEAESVAAGLALCQTRAIDAVLLDYRLPDGNGLDFLELLSAQSNGSSPPVVMISGQGNEKTAVRAIKLGAEDYLVKSDLTTELLLATIRSAIENTRLRLELQHQKERFQTAIENMLDCFGIYSAIRDRAGQIVDFRFDYLNAAAMQGNRMTEADMSRTHCEVFPAIRETELFVEYCQVVETGIPLVKEDLVYTDVFGGEQLTNAYHMQVAKLDDGITLSWRDITAQKQVELSLTAANQQMTTIWESMTDAYVTLDLDWRIVYANSAAAQVINQLTNRSSAEFLGSTHWEVFPWLKGTIVEQEYRRAVTEGVAVHFELFYEPTETWFEIHAYPSTEGLGIYFRDIHQRKLGELAQIAAEREHERFFELSIDLLVVANLEGYFIRINPAFAQLLGFTSAEMMAQPFLDFVHPDDRAATMATAESMYPGSVVVNFENRYRCKDGSYRWILWNAIPDLECSALHANGRDITELKRDEQLLSQSEEFKRRILESSRDCIKVLDLAGRLIYMNDYGQSLLEIDDFSTVASHQWVELWQGSERESAQTALNTALAGGVARFDGYCATAKGTPKWWEVIVAPIFAADGRVCQILLVSRDITDRKIAEKHLQESEQRLKAGVEVAGLGLAKFDYATNLVELSPEAAILYGFAPDTSVITRAQFHATFHPDERAELDAVIAQVLDPQGTGWFAQDHRVVWPNGEVRCLSVRKRVYFDRSGAVARPIYAILAAIDVTDRNQNQADLEERNRELDSFVYVVSHDLKAPLRAVSNLSQWIEDDLEGQLTADTRSQMTLLRSRVDRMAATIDGLLEYARCGRSEDKIELVAVARLLADVIDSVALPPTFTIALPAELPTLSTKRLPLFQVFVNLIGNGIEHHHSEAGTIEISIEDRGDFYEFAVSDDGSGIAPEHHDRMFKIFQAVNPQNRSDSTGIGLAIVKKIIEAEGGTIRLESEIGSGTTFYFTWPKRSGDPRT